MLRYLRNREFWGITLTLLALLLISHFFSGRISADNFLSKGIRFLFTPAQTSVDKMRVYFDGYSHLLQDKKKLEQEIGRLTEQLDQFKLKGLYLEEYRAEIERLQSMFDFQSRYQGEIKLVNAHVIARSPNNWNQLITIDCGSNDGIQTNMPVITPDGLVGIVSSAGRSTAQVYLITDREIAVGVILQPSREARGIVEGAGSAVELKMVNIPYYSQIQAGDLVITSGLSEVYPKGIPVGTVKEIFPENGGLLLAATIEPKVRFDQLEEVMVITSFTNALDFSAEEEPAAQPEESAEP